MGAGNHYGEVQVVDEIFDRLAAKKMGIDRTGQVVVMVHCGSRGLGHQVATGTNYHFKRQVVNKITILTFLRRFGRNGKGNETR